jgi:ABC-type glycerol-3-phosphate transport system substrate-binding protein
MCKRGIMKPIHVRITLLLSLLLLLVACDTLTEQLTQTAVATVAPTPTAEIELEEGGETAVNEGTEEFTPEAEESVHQLIIWLPPSFTDMVDVEGETAVFQEQLRAFQQKHPDIDIIVEKKAVEGSGGMFDYLRTSRPIAPTILPHLLILPVDRLPVATEAGLLQPMETTISDEMVADLYPSAARMVEVDGSMMGYPIFVHNFSHMIYNETLFSDGLQPRRWRALTAVDEAKFAFPAAGTDGAILLLQRYFAEGGRVADDDGTPILELEPLTNALIAFEEATVGGTIIPASATMNTLDQVWPLLEDGIATVAQTNVMQFLQQPTLVEGMAYAPMPGPQKPLTPLLDGWAWALPLSSDEATQDLAIELITFLSKPAQLGAWSEDSGFLPASHAALAEWSIINTPYMQFINTELAGADEMPIADHSTIMLALTDAIFSVVSLNQTAIEAAQTAVSTISP